MPLFDAQTVNPLTVPYRAEAPQNYAQGRDLLVKSGLRAIDMAKANLQKKMDDQPLQARRANYIVSQGRMQAGLGFAKLAMLADGSPSATVTMYWKVGEKIIFQSNGAPTADACDAIRRVWMSGIWYETWEKGIAKNLVSMNNLPAVMFESGAELFKNKGYGLLQTSQQVRDTINDAGQMLFMNRPRKLFYQFGISKPLMNYCLNGNMTYADTGAALPLYSAPYPGLFRP